MLDNNQGQVPALQRSLKDILDEYTEKCVGAEADVAAFHAKVAHMDTISTVGGAFVHGFDLRTHLSASDVKRRLLRSAWRHVYSGLNIGKVATAKDRGPICLHASRHRPHIDDLCALHSTFDLIDPIEQIGPYRFSTTQHTVDWARGLQSGGIVGTAEIVDCVEQSDSPWFFGPYGLVLENVQPVEFIPVKGALGLFDWRKNT